MESSQIRRLHRVLTVVFPVVATLRLLGSAFGWLPKGNFFFWIMLFIMPPASKDARILVLWGTAGMLLIMIGLGFVEHVLGRTGVALVLALVLMLAFTAAMFEWQHRKQSKS